MDVVAEGQSLSVICGREYGACAFRAWWGVCPSTGSTEFTYEPLSSKGQLRKTLSRSMALFTDRLEPLVWPLILLSVTPRGTICQTGSLEVRTTTLPGESAVSQIRRIVAEVSLAQVRPA